MKLVWMLLYVATLPLQGAQGMQVEGSKWDKPKYANKPRVRREWRKLSEVTKSKVARAFWTLKNLTTAEGQAIYGKKFHNHDEMLLMHSCAVLDPRCDQGHFGPHFITFHRALLLKYELALLSVDPSIGAMPYWDMSLDSVDGAYRNDPKKYIFTDKYFGDYFGNETEAWAVTNGLFAYWPVAIWSSQKHGKESPLAAISECVRREYFVPPNCSEDNTTKLLRAHQDCTPFVARYPRDASGPNAVLGGTSEITYTAADFLACTDPSNAPVWMAWQNCIEISRVACNVRARDALQLSTEEVEALQAKAYSLPNREYSHAASNSTAHIMELLRSGPQHCDFQSYTSGRKRLNALHSQAHVKFGKDFFDVTTSPNEAGPFTGYHSNIDRSNFIWMENVGEKVRISGYTYPKDQTDTATWDSPPYGTSGPFGVYQMAVCSDKQTYPEYSRLESPWIPGSLYGDVVNSAFPFFNLFECDESESCDGGKDGYTHRDILHWTSPQRTPYTYDSLEHMYYDTEEDPSS
eukprot:Hpha_TRINITY_DN3590_c0_g1::TRINITY_DN3590_c0_g1_i1::g.25686::m.25686